MGISLTITMISAGTIMRAFLYRHLVKVLHPVPKLLVARVVDAASESQSSDGNLDFCGTHHTSCSFSVTPEYLRDFAEMAGIEFLLIDQNTLVDEFKECFERSIVMEQQEPQSAI